MSKWLHFAGKTESEWLEHQFSMHGLSNQSIAKHVKWLYLLVMFLMFLQVLGSPLVAYSRFLVGPFSSPGDREFLLSTFGHVGSPPRHLKVGNKKWENVETCGEKCGNWEIFRSGEDCWLKLLQLLPFQGTPECRKKTTTPWSLFPQTSRWGFGDQVHQLKKQKSEAWQG